MSFHAPPTLHTSHASSLSLYLLTHVVPTWLARMGRVAQDKVRRVSKQCAEWFSRPGRARDGGQRREGALRGPIS